MMGTLERRGEGRNYPRNEASADGTDMKNMESEVGKILHRLIFAFDVLLLRLLRASLINCKLLSCNGPMASNADCFLSRLAVVRERTYGKMKKKNVRGSTL